MLSWLQSIGLCWLMAVVDEQLDSNTLLGFVQKGVEQPWVCEPSDGDIDGLLSLGEFLLDTVKDVGEQGFGLHFFDLIIQQYNQEAVVVASRYQIEEQDFRLN